MELNENLKSTFLALEKFVLKEQERAGGVQVDFNGRDRIFLDKARSAIESGESTELRELLKEMRGLSHYFCSYSKNTKALDTLLDNFFSSVQKAAHD